MFKGKKMSTITFGTDPEVFIYRDTKKYGSRNIPVPIIIPPAALVDDYGAEIHEEDNKKVLVKDRDFQWSEDGAAIEAQILPSDTSYSFNNKFASSLSSLSSYIRNLNPELKVSTLPLGYFDTNIYWKKRDENFRQCVIFGCDPDQSPDIYREIGLESWDNYGEELDVSSHTFRYAGGHLHIQSPENNPELYFPIWDMASIIFDTIIGLTNTSLERTADIKELELARLKYYGKPGRIRLQDYGHGKMGIEYRVMSNYWLTGLRSNINTILSSAKIAVSIIEEGQSEAFVNQIYQRIPEIYQTIIALDESSAKQILEEELSKALENGYLNLTSFYDGS
jgi:hypothetical protein